MEMRNGAQILDMEMLIPLDKPFSPPNGTECKPTFLLTNALKIRHEGNPALLQNTVNQLNDYIVSNKLTPITVGYNVTIVKPETPTDMDRMVVDVYVGISPNAL
jgi:hypothetical protein